MVAVAWKPDFMAGPKKTTAKVHLRAQETHAFQVLSGPARSVQKYAHVMAKLMSSSLIHPSPPAFFPPSNEIDNSGSHPLNFASEFVFNKCRAVRLNVPNTQECEACLRGFWKVGMVLPGNVKSQRNTAPQIMFYELLNASKRVVVQQIIRNVKP